jgi:putative ABC transport system permease protein
MIAHFFRVIWFRKKENFMTSLGIFISFIVLFLVTSFLVYTAINYFKPIGFEYKNVWKITMDWKDSTQEEKLEIFQQMENTLKSAPEIESFGYSVSFLFAPSVLSTLDFEYEGSEFSTNLHSGSDDLDEVLGIKMLEGRWFDETDNASNYQPIVLNYMARDEAFPNESALGKIVKIGENEYQIIGVIGEFRKGGRFTGSSKLTFRRISLEKENEFNRFTGEALGSRVLLRMKPNTSVQFEQTLTKRLEEINRDWQFKVNPLESLKKSADTQTLILPVILAVVCGFLIINVGLGLFGVIWYNTNRRRAEIGLRRALGSTANNILRQIIGEALVLSTLAMIFGSFFALQFPILGLLPMFDAKVYTIAYIVSILVIYLITSLCAWYPSRIAASIEPADALRDE